MSIELPDNLFEYTPGVPPQGQRFAYYTSASVASSMLRSGEFWMRNARVMNDYSEVEHGMRCLDTIFRGGNWKKIQGALERREVDLAQKLERDLKTLGRVLREMTYITCVTEHNKEDERYGRLSMWRAYGGDESVALVLDAAAISKSSFANTYFRKVQYLDDAGVEARMEDIAERIADNAEFLRSRPPIEILSAMFWLLRDLVLCTKHPAFDEEREWRLIAPAHHLEWHKLPLKLREVHGVPQMVAIFEIASAAPSPSVSDWLHCLLIGPSQHPEVVCDAFRQLLRDEGVDDPGGKIRLSNIPLRRK